MADTEFEEWRPIPGLEGRYEASSLGRIRGWYKQAGKRLLEPTLRSPYLIRATGYLGIGVCVGNKRRTTTVHALVCAAFHGPRPDGFVSNHIDGNKANSRADNLEWVSPSDNNIHAIRTGLAPVGRRKPNAKLTEATVALARAEYAARTGTVKILAARYGVSFGTMRAALRGMAWQTVPGAVPIRRDVCRNGHARTPDNQYRSATRGRFDCAVCRAENARRFIERRRAARGAAV